ncbi:uncharacterized protein [Panulirus ornatus]|uniref:uncharacterized protein n=1 Tax=Panulirus ornatus TaxID=150431 RepID=UPI003A89BDC7
MSGRAGRPGWQEVSRCRMLQTLLALSSLCLCIPLACTAQRANDYHTLFVTLPTVFETIPTLQQGHDQQDYLETTTDYPMTSPVLRESQNGERSALIRPSSQDAKMMFLADDYEAASRIPELLTSLRRVSGTYDNLSLFPKTRSRSKGSIAAGQDRRIALDTGRSAGSHENYLEQQQHLGADPQVDLEVRFSGSSFLTHFLDHLDAISAVPGRLRAPSSPIPRSQGYWPSPFGSLRRPSLMMSPGASLIDKKESQSSGLPPHGMLDRPNHNMTRVLTVPVVPPGARYPLLCMTCPPPPRQKNMMWNTLTVQYNPLIEEVWDEHFKVTCEYGYDFWKTVTFPFLDVEVQTGNPVVFTLTPPECHMEIRYGIGTTGERVTGPVRVGDPLTLVIYMRSEFEGFDIVVSDCYAHNGGNKRIALIDHYGCPLDESLISHFEGARRTEGVFETQVYAFMKTFRFTGSPALYLECDVRMCHGDCPIQPCHWRRKKKQRRSVHQQQQQEDNNDPEESTNVSESLSLFQSIQVVRDDQLLHTTLRDEDAGRVCLKSGTFSALAGMVAVVVGILTAACGVLCLRLRRAQKPDEPPPPTTPFVTHYRADFVPPIKRRLE